MKKTVIDFWDNFPCGTRNIPADAGSEKFFELTQKRRYQLEPFISRYAQFERWKDKKVLEIGCGTGVDSVQFLKSGADIYAVDFSAKSVILARNRLKACGFNQQRIFVADAESLPFSDNQFDFVYSWGVLHHTADIEKAVSQIYRVVRPDGKICVMLYHKPSLVVFQLYCLFGLFSFKPFKRVDEIIVEHLESPGTKAYTKEQAKNIFRNFADVAIQTIITPYDLRYWRDRHKNDKFFPAGIGKYIPSCLGWFMVINARRP